MTSTKELKENIDEVQGDLNLDGKEGLAELKGRQEALKDVLEMSNVFNNYIQETLENGLNFDPRQLAGEWNRLKSRIQHELGVIRDK